MTTHPRCKPQVIDVSDGELNARAGLLSDLAELSDALGGNDPVDAALPLVLRMLGGERVWLASTGSRHAWHLLGRRRDDEHERDAFERDAAALPPTAQAAGVVHLGGRTMCAVVPSPLSTSYALGVHRHEHGRPFTREDELLLLELARRIEGALTTLATLSQVRELQERHEEQRLFSAQHALTRVLAESPTLADATPRILQALCEALGWDVGALWQREGPNGELGCASLWRRAGVGTRLLVDIAKGARVSVDDELIGVIWSGRTAQSVSDLNDAPRSPLALSAGKDALRSAFGFPVLADSEVWGVIHFFSKERRDTEADLLAVGTTLGSQIGQYVERMRAEVSLQQVRDQLAHVTRVATLGEIAASIAHEVNQPITGIVTNAQAGLRWLSREPPDLGEASEAFLRLARDGKRAGEVIARLRALVRRGDTCLRAELDLNQLVRDTLPLLRGELQRAEVSVDLQLAASLPLVVGDRVQVQQVLLNLLINGLEAMSSVKDGARRLRIQSADDVSSGVRLSVQDNGSGLPAHVAAKVFDAFFTTKPQGLGMGLAISRSIVEQHGGRLTTAVGPGPGTVFQFTLPKSPARGTLTEAPPPRPDNVRLNT